MFLRTCKAWVFVKLFYEAFIGGKAFGVKELKLFYLFEAKMLELVFIGYEIPYALDVYEFIGLYLAGLVVVSKAYKAVSDDGLA